MSVLGELKKNNTGGYLFNTERDRTLQMEGLSWFNRSSDLNQIEGVGNKGGQTLIAHCSIIETVDPIVMSGVWGRYSAA